MKSLEINDNIWINIYEISFVIGYTNSSCSVCMKTGQWLRCTKYSARELESKVLEEIYYDGDNGICKEDKWWNQESKA